MSTMITDLLPLAQDRHIILRDQLPSDVDRFVYWQTHGEWQHLDAPWEGFGESLTPEEEENIRTHFLKRCQAEKKTPRKTAAIVLKDGLRPLGWVNCYAKEELSKVAYVGISICEDDALGHGLGTEALRLWVHYIFTNSDFHKVALETWSFNPRMMHVAEKAGFIPEGAERELRQWQGQWLDRMCYGILRCEWDKVK